MKKMIVVLAAVAALAATSAAPASARGCRTVKCFNNRITTLQSEVVELAGALNCLQPVPVTRYGGYDYNGYVGASTALDFTESGDGVGVWLMGIAPGNCGAPHSVSAARSAPKSSGTARDAFGPFQSIPRSVDRSHGARP